MSTTMVRENKPKVSKANFDVARMRKALSSNVTQVPSNLTREEKRALILSRA
jgi:predicted Ser/Thr protein kinase